MFWKDKDKESRNKVLQKLSTITENKDEEKLEAELEIEDEENMMN